MFNIGDCPVNKVTHSPPTHYRNAHMHPHVKTTLSGTCTHTHALSDLPPVIDLATPVPTTLAVATPSVRLPALLALPIPSMLALA